MKPNLVKGVCNFSTVYMWNRPFYNSTNRGSQRRRITKCDPLLLLSYQNSRVSAIAIKPVPLASNSKLQWRLPPSLPEVHEGTTRPPVAHNIPNRLSPRFLKWTFSQNLYRPSDQCESPMALCRETCYHLLSWFENLTSVWLQSKRLKYLNEVNGRLTLW